MSSFDSQTSARNFSSLGTIQNDDFNTVSVAVSAPVIENSGGELTYTFTRTGSTTSSLVADFTFVGTDLPRGTTVSATGQVSAGRVTGEGTVAADDGQGHRVERRLLVTPPDWNDLIRSY